MSLTLLFTNRWNTFALSCVGGFRFYSSGLLYFTSFLLESFDTRNVQTLDFFFYFCRLENSVLCHSVCMTYKQRSWKSWSQLWMKCFYLYCMAGEPIIGLPARMILLFNCGLPLGIIRIDVCYFAILETWCQTFCIDVVLAVFGIPLKTDFSGLFVMYAEGDRE